MFINHKYFTFLNVLFLEVILLSALALFADCVVPNPISLEKDTFVVEVVSDAEVLSEEEYAQLCFRKEYYFCPPLNEVWQMYILSDICKDPPEVVEISECVEVWECDPSDIIIGEESCVTEDGYPGMATVYCDKGIIKEGECVSPCFEEICDYVDNNCNGQIDEGQTNACGDCGLTPQEICNGVDDDCDGSVDEDLIRDCFTACDTGYEICVNGLWATCTAIAPQDEVCDGWDNDCDGQTDEELFCECPPELIGALLPCAESPLFCGQGFKTCQCANPDCTKTIMSECLAACVFVPVADEPCDPQLGYPTNETCNNFDDDCDEEIDEDLHLPCYTGPDGTVEVGICKSGDAICVAGTWGAITDSGFVPNMCDGEITPQKEICNGADDDCDGIIDYGMPMDPTDILLIVDVSGSMNMEITAVLSALQTFSLFYSDEEALRWGLILGPILDPTPCAPGQCPNILDVCYDGACLSCGSWQDMFDACTVFAPDTPCHTVFCAGLPGLGIPLTEVLKLSLDFANFSAFLSALNTGASLTGANSGSEMLIDALYLSVYPLATSTPVPLTDLDWLFSIASSPPILSFSPSWREDEERLIILFTDEPPQSYLDPPLTGNDVDIALGTSPDLKLYTFTTEGVKNGNYGEPGWVDLAHTTDGGWFLLSINPVQLLTDLLQILDENVCQ